jgi:hypothetical protein
MVKESGRDEGKPREVSRAKEDEESDVSLDGVDRKVEDDWSSSGTEDPAFFIKPSDGE